MRKKHFPLVWASRHSDSVCTVLLLWPAQENDFSINVLAYQWTTTHNTLTFTYPGHADTSCNGNVDMNGRVSSGGNFSASATTSDTCSTSFTPPTSQNIDIQKPVVYILADSETSRMVLTCTRNVRWSQCHALNPGQFTARMNKGRFEVQALFGKGKEEWVSFDIVQQTAIGPPQPKSVVAQEASASIEAPKSDTSNSNSGFPTRWKSMTSGRVFTIRFEGEYIYVETVVPEAAAKAGVFFLTEAKKDGDKYVGKANGRMVRAEGGPSCAVSGNIEFTLVTPNRIEGRGSTPPPNAKLDWDTCLYTPAPDWQSFVWIPVR
jgi:hypothetical protein